MSSDNRRARTYGTGWPHQVFKKRKYYKLSSGYGLWSRRLLISPSSSDCVTKNSFVTPHRHLYLPLCRAFEDKIDKMNNFPTPELRSSDINGIIAQAFGADYIQPLFPLSLEASHVSLNTSQVQTGYNGGSQQTILQELVSFGNTEELINMVNHPIANFDFHVSVEVGNEVNAELDPLTSGIFSSPDIDQWIPSQEQSTVTTPHTLDQQTINETRNDFLWQRNDGQVAQNHCEGVVGAVSKSSSHAKSRDADINCRDQINTMNSTTGLSVSPEQSMGLNDGISPPKHPSNFCHICSKLSRNKPRLICGNYTKGLCYKTICKGCFVKHSLGNFDLANNPQTEWTCTHCRRCCPSKAQCATYTRVNNSIRRKRKRTGTFPLISIVNQVSQRSQILTQHVIRDENFGETPQNRDNRLIRRLTTERPNESYPDQLHLIPDLPLDQNDLGQSILYTSNQQEQTRDGA